MFSKLWFQAVVAATAVALLFFAPPASAGTITTWTGGGGNGSWTTSGNWNPSGNAPATSGTYALTFGGTTQTVTTNGVGTVAIDSLAFTNSGTLAPNQNASFTISGGTLAFGGASITTTAAAGTLFPTNGAADGDRIESAMTLSGTSTVTLGAFHNLSLVGNISGNGGLVIDDSAPGSVQYVYLSGTNSYSGGTEVRGGFVQSGLRTSLASNNLAFGSGSITISDNGTVLVRNNSVLSNALTVSGSGMSGNSLTGSFGTTNQTAEYAGPITVVGSTRFSSAASAGATNSKFLISGPVNLGGNQLTLRSGNLSGTGVLIQITGTISGSGGITVEGQAASGRVLISGSNNYSGGTTVTTGTLIVGSSSALGTGFLAVNTSGLDLNGQNLVVGALSGSSAGLISAGVAGPASLRSVSADSTTYAGTIADGSGTVSFGLAGTGTLTFTGSNGYTGVTNIDGGVLVLGGSNVLAGGGDIDFGGGTLRYTASNTLDYSARIKDSGQPISIDTNGQTVTFASAVASSNTAGLTKIGPGTLALNAANQFAGTTTVSQGTLAGTGSVLGLLSVGSGGVFSPGASPTSTAVFGVGAFAQVAGGTTSLQINGTTAGAQFDQVSFSGASKTVSWGGQLDLVLSGSYATDTSFSLFDGFTSQGGDLAGISFSAPGSPYSLLSFVGPVGGLWKTGTTAGGQSLEFDQKTGVLTIVPEPSAMALAGVGVAVCCLRGLGRRRSGRSAA